MTPSWLLVLLVTTGAGQQNTLGGDITVSCLFSPREAFHANNNSHSYNVLAFTCNPHSSPVKGDYY